MKDEFDILKEQNIDAGLLEGLAEFRSKYPVEEIVRDRVTKTGGSIFWERDFGDVYCFAFAGGKSAAFRSEGNRKECVGGESCMDVWQTFLQRVISCEYRKRRADRHRHISG